MLLIDSHCHPDLLDYRTKHASVDDMMQKAQAREVGFIMAVATTLTGFTAMMTLLGHRRDVAFSCGVHPLNVDDGCDFQQLHMLAQDVRVLALGETGLDYHHQPHNMLWQQTVFCQHIRIARALKKPVIVHTRAARDDTLALLRAEQAQECGGVLHCFTEDQSTAAALLDLGFYISFSGIITFRNAEQLRDVVRYVPLDRLLIETDSPYLAPVPYRGKENQPAYVREVAQCIAMLKSVSLETLAQATSSNFCRLFQLDPSLISMLPH